MKIGKIPENVLIRSVLKYVKKDLNLEGPGSGKDGVLVRKNGKPICITSDAVVYDKERLADYALINAVNNVAAHGGILTDIAITLLLPDRTEESFIRNFMESLTQKCSEKNVRLLCGHTEITTALVRPVLTVTGYGEAEERYVNREKVCPGDSIVMSRWAGMQGTALLLDRYRAQLQQRYTKKFLDGASKFHEYLSLEEEGRIGVQCGVKAMHDASYGGIFGALWEMSTALKAGIEIQMEKIPMRQETIEITEFLGINPYQLHSGGSMLMVTDEPQQLIKELEKVEIPAVKIGEITKKKEKICYLQGEKAFLTPARRDVLNDLYFGKREDKNNL